MAKSSVMIHAPPGTIFYQRTGDGLALHIKNQGAGVSRFSTLTQSLQSPPQAGFTDSLISTLQPACCLRSRV